MKRFTFLLSCQMILSSTMIQCMVDDPWNQSFNKEYGLLQLNKNGPKNFKSLPPPFEGFYAGVPYIGSYATPYKIRETLGIIQFPAQSLHNVVPLSLQTNLSDHITDDTQITFYIIITGQYILDEKPHTENLIFHTVALDWTKSNPPFFSSTNYQAGIFNPYHISQHLTANSISINAFQATAIHPHPPQDFSPNNAQFSFTTTSKFCSFWSSIINNDKSKAIITYHIIINEQNIAKFFVNGALKGIINTSKTITEFISNLKEESKKEYFPTEITESITNILIVSLNDIQTNDIIKINETLSLIK